MTDERKPPLEPEILPGETRAAERGVGSIPVGRPVGGAGHSPAPPPPRPPRRRLPLILFLLTCASTVYTGTGQFRVPKTVIDPATGKRMLPIEIDPATRRGRLLTDWRQTLLNGLTYATAVMVMLAAHEMGHYLQARRYGVPASLPLFMPMPYGPLGTMGAVIVQEPGAADRKSMFDIAISGPLAGLAVALPLTWWGIQHSAVIKMPPNEVAWTNPLIVEWLIGWIHQPLQPGQDIALNPIFFPAGSGSSLQGSTSFQSGSLTGDTSCTASWAERPMSSPGPCILAPSASSSFR
jgi:Zn-dependent protease